MTVVMVADSGRHGFDKGSLFYLALGQRAIAMAIARRSQQVRK